MSLINAIGQQETVYHQMRVDKHLDIFLDIPNKWESVTLLILNRNLDNGTIGKWS